jgi:type VI secretion system protein ImpJ
LLADEIPQPVQWHEGMLLAPQHFQQSSWRQEMLVQYSALLVAPYCWGVRRMSLDTQVLASGTFRVLSIEAVLPDGAVVAFEHDTGSELMIDLALSADDMRASDMTVYLALPARGSASVKGALARYQAEEGPLLADENTGDGEVRIPVLKPVLTLIAGEKPPPKYVSLPIARVRFEDEAFVLTDYIAPTMSVPLRSPLGEMCSRLVARLREKAMFVSEQVRSPSAVLEKPLLLENKGRMQSLVAGLPPFEALLSTGAAHPLTLYLALCGLSGHLAALGASLLPPAFSPYDHSDLRASFQEVLSFALRMTNEGIPETYGAWPFQLKDRIFNLTFETEWVTRRLVLGMRVSTGFTEKEMIAWGEECLIGTESVIPSLRDKRIRGAHREFVETDRELVPVRGVLLFTLRPDPEFIKPGEILQIRNPGERGRSSGPLEIVLYVKHGS